jgi:hypothetical protein
MPKSRKKSTLRGPAKSKSKKNSLREKMKKSGTGGTCGPC